MGTVFTMHSEENGNSVNTKKLSWDDIMRKENVSVEACYIFGDLSWTGTAREEYLFFHHETPQNLVFHHTVHTYHQDTPRKEFSPIDTKEQTETLLFHKTKRTLRRVTRNSR